MTLQASHLDLSFRFHSASTQLDPGPVLGLETETETEPDPRPKPSWEQVDRRAHGDVTTVAHLVREHDSSFRYVSGSDRHRQRRHLEKDATSVGVGVAAAGVVDADADAGHPGGRGFRIAVANVDVDDGAAGAGADGGVADLGRASGVDAGEALVPCIRVPVPVPDRDP